MLTNFPRLVDSEVMISLRFIVHVFAVYEFRCVYCYCSVEVFRRFRSRKVHKKRIKI